MARNTRRDSGFTAGKASTKHHKADRHEGGTREQRGLIGGSSMPTGSMLDPAHRKAARVGRVGGRAGKGW